MNLTETIKSAGILIALLAVSRLIGMPDNASPLMGLAVFAHRMNLSPWVAVGILAVTDVFFLGLYGHMPIVYASMFGAYFIGKYMRNVYASGVVSVLVWHVVVNMGLTFPPFSPEAMLFDMRLLASTLAFTALLDITQRLTQTGSHERKVY
jgi:hypothetical protein|tara:strand:- start:109 stop:561 length:453 start_codon:yes stop_codon:yes gene_type:complete